jgi:hypothetical protein
MGLLKATAMFRKTLAALPTQTGDADVLVLLKLAAVCRYWARITVTRLSGRQQLKRLFTGKSLSSLYQCISVGSVEMDTTRGFRQDWPRSLNSGGI